MSYIEFEVHREENNLDERYTLEPGTVPRQEIDNIYGDVNEDLEVKTLSIQHQPKVRKITPFPGNIVTDLNATEIVTVIENPDYNM